MPDPTWTVAQGVDVEPWLHWADHHDIHWYDLDELWDSTEAADAWTALVDCVAKAEQADEWKATAAKGAIASAKAHRWDEMVKRLAEMVAAITEHAEAGDVMAEHDLGLLEPLLLLAGDDDGG